MTTEPASDSTAARKARGAFFTPPSVTTFLTGWAIRDPSDRVLEPSCGDGAFITAIVHRMRSLGGGRNGCVVAHELHPESAAQARALLSADDYGEVLVGDFLASPVDPTFDAVVGNPPYIRYQGFTGEARATGRAAALAQGVRLSNLASSWAPFVVHAAAFVNEAGRLALVLPAELLTSNYAQDVRDFLLRRFAQVSVVLVSRQVFPGVQTETVLLLAEGTGGTNEVGFALCDDVSQLDEISVDLVVDTRPGERWNAGVVSTDAQDLLRSLADEEAWNPLSHWGRLSLGAVTGNNQYFTLSPEGAAELGLVSSDVVAISPAGSSHLRALGINRRNHAQLGAQGARTLLFRPVEPSAAARDYIAQGESQRVNQAYKCRVRTPWWRTPLPAPPDVFFTYMNHATPQLAANQARLHYLNSVHGLYLDTDKKELAKLLPLAALNTATALSAEMSGRAYGGGILKLEPREAARLLVPSAQTVRACEAPLRELLPTVRRLLIEGRLEDAQIAVDRVLLHRVVTPQMDLAILRQAYARMRQRRHGLARSRARDSEVCP